MFVGVAKIPTANTFNELAGVGFVDYGGCAAFLNIQGNFPRFAAIIFYGHEEEGGTDGRNGAGE